MTILLQMGDRTAQEHGLEKRVIHALTFLAQDQELKELMLDDIVHLVDAILTEHGELVTEGAACCYCCWIPAMPVR